MSENVKLRIDLEAAKALIQWKVQFADEVCERAKELAIQSDQPNYVTLLQYRQAAEIALQSLSNTIRNGDTTDAERNAA